MTSYLPRRIEATFSRANLLKKQEARLAEMFTLS
jgi:hypothetical protein